MVQVDVIFEKMKSIKIICDSHPYYSKLGLDSNRSYNDAVLDEFLRSNGDFNRKVLREELEQLLIKHHIAMEHSAMEKSKSNEVINVQSE